MKTSQQEPEEDQNAAPSPTGAPVHIPSTRVRIILGLMVLGLFLALLYQVREILAPFVISLILTYLLEPPVRRLAAIPLGRRHLGRGSAVLIVYVLIFTVLALASYLVIPRLYHEVEHIAREAPKYVTKVQKEQLPGLIKAVEERAGRAGMTLDIRSILEDSFFGMLEAGKGEALRLASHLKDLIGGVFTTVTNLIIIFLLTAFLLIDVPGLKAGFAGLVPDAYRDEVRHLVTAVNADLSGVVRGQALICMINGTLTTLGLLALQIKYALTIGVIAGLFSLIPVFGSLISSVPAVLMALTQSWIVALEVVGVIALIHLIEANFLNPKILGHEVDLHPFIILFAIVAGERLLGIGGLLLGVPCAAVMRTLLVHVFERYIFPASPPEAISSPARVKGHGL